MSRAQAPSPGMSAVKAVRSSTALLMILGMSSWRKSTAIRQPTPRRMTVRFSEKYGLRRRMAFMALTRSYITIAAGLQPLMPAASKRKGAAKIQIAALAD